LDAFWNIAWTDVRMIEKRQERKDGCIVEVPYSDNLLVPNNYCDSLQSTIRMNMEWPTQGA
jgi:hypothetical protein